MLGGESDTGQAEARDEGMSASRLEASQSSFYVQMCRFQPFQLLYSAGRALAKARMLCWDRSGMALRWHKLNSTEI